MRRFLLFLMLCLLPLQVSWAVVADYCGHEQDKATHHFGHHDDEHKAVSDTPDDGKQPGTSGIGHDHCHLSGFLGILSTFTLTAHELSQPSLHCGDCPFSHLAPDQPERPKWSVPA
jgi:hypothetical protein